MNKGVSLYLALMIMSLIFAVAFGMSLILISQLKMLKGMENSVIAIYAADTGIERILYEDKVCRPPICSTSAPPEFCPETNCAGLPDGYVATIVLENDASYNAELSSTTEIIIKSVGKYKETRRALQATR